MGLTRVLYGKMDQGPVLVLHVGSDVYVGSVFKCGLPIHKVHLQFSLHVIDVQNELLQLFGSV